jgi:hypothetical protein
MAYTRNWDSTTPAGSAQLSAGDDAIRALKEDLEERFATLVDDIDADPWVLKEDQVGTIGSKVGKTLTLGPHILQPRQDEHDIEYQLNYVQFDGTETQQGTFQLPPDVTITGFEAFVDPFSGVTVTVTLYKTNITTGVVADIAAVTRSSAGIGPTSDPGVLAEVVHADQAYCIKMVGNGCRAYGFRITYDTPDARNTI